MIYWVIGTEVNRPFVWGFMFLWLGVQLVFYICCRYKGRRRQFPLAYLLLSPLLTLDFSDYSSARSLYLAALSAIALEPQWWGGKVLGRGVFHNLLIISQPIGWPVSGLWPSQEFLQAYRFFSLPVFISIPWLQHFQFISLKPWALLTIFFPPLGEVGRLEEAGVGRDYLLPLG